MKIRYFGFLLLLVGIASCDVQEVEYYKKQIYISYSGEQTHTMKIKPTTTDTLISVYCGGSLSPDVNVDVELKVDQEALDSLNLVKFSSTSDYFKLLPDSCYEINSYKTTITKGSVYGTLPISFKTAKIDPLQKYVLPLSIKSASAFEINTSLKTVFITVNLINKFSGLYRFNGNAVEEGRTSKAKITREQNFIVAGENAVLMHAESKTFEKDGNSYLIRAIINPDNTITMTSDDQANLKVENCLPYAGVTPDPAIDNKYDPATGNMRLIYKYNDFTKTGKMRIVVVDLIKIG